HLGGARGNRAGAEVRGRRPAEPPAVARAWPRSAPLATPAHPRAARDAGTRALASRPACGRTRRTRIPTIEPGGRRVAQPPFLSARDRGGGRCSATGPRAARGARATADHPQADTEVR